MEETITITKEEYMELIKLKVRVETIVDFIEADTYLSKEIVFAILGIKEDK